MGEKEQNNEMEEAKEEQRCCYHLALMTSKQIKTRNKKTIDKVRLNESDIDKLNASDDHTKIDLNSQQMFIASEVIPSHIFEYPEDERFKQWIGFLFNGIDAKDDRKKIY